MIKHLSLLLIIIMSLLLTFFCVEYHKETILATAIPQMQKDKIAIKIEQKIIEETPKPTNKNSLQVIESVVHIEPVITITVDKSEANRPIIKKLSTKELLGEEPTIPPSLIIAQPTTTSIKEEEIPTPTVAMVKPQVENLEEIERKMLQEMNRELATPTPTPTNNIITITEKATIEVTKTQKNTNNEMSEIERLMLEEIKNFK